MLIKTPLLHQSLGPRVFLSFSIYFWLIPWSVETRWAHFLARASKTHSGGHLVPTCSIASPKNRTLLAFRENQGISASFSLLLSRLPGSGPLKNQQALSASFSLLLSYRRLWTTRFWSIKGPTQDQSEGKFSNFFKIRHVINCRLDIWIDPYLIPESIYLKHFIF